MTPRVCCKIVLKEQGVASNGNQMRKKVQGRKFDYRYRGKKGSRGRRELKEPQWPDFEGGLLEEVVKRSKRAAVT